MDFKFEDMRLSDSEGGEGEESLRDIEMQFASPLRRDSLGSEPELGFGGAAGAPGGGSGSSGRGWHDSEDGFELPEAASSAQQLKAMLRRQWLMKERGWGQTLMEVLTPVAMMWVLVLAYGLTTPVHYDAAVFANQSVPILDSLTGRRPASPQTLAQSCPAAQQLFAQVGVQGLMELAVLLSKLNRGNGSLPLNSTADIQRQATPLLAAWAEGHGLSEESLAGLATCVQLSRADETRVALKSLVDYHGPLPIPSFDQFVTLHNLILQSFEGEGGANSTLQQVVRAQKVFGNVMGNLLQLGRLTFAPNSTEVAGLVDFLSKKHKLFRSVYGGTFSTEAEAVEGVMSDLGEDIWAVVVVRAMRPAQGNVDYTIRMNYTTLPRTYRVIHKWRHGLIKDYKRYYTSGFLTLQTSIDEYASVGLPHSAETEAYGATPVWGVPFPVPEYTHNFFYNAVGPLMGLVMCLSMLYPLGMLVKALVEEKETRAKEMMRIMGLRSWVFSASWALTYLAVFSFVSLTVTIILRNSFIRYSDALVVFLLFFLFTASLIPFGFFVSAFFSRAKLASFVGPFVLFAAIMPRYIFFRAGSQQAIPAKTLASILPPTAFTFGVDLLGMYEGVNTGLGWSNLAEDDFSLARILTMLFADIFIYTFLAWYVEHVLPSEFGAHHPPWFLFTRSYWLPDDVAPSSSASYQELSTTEDTASGEVEPAPPGAGRVVVTIRGLRKVYRGGKVAIDGLDLDVHEGQITALLGHNGAGKSTTIAVLTGLVRPSGGDARIWGRSVRAGGGAFRRVVGVCPQQNVLFQRLTVAEHLELYAALKGVSPHAISTAVHSMVDSLALADKAHTRAAALSGGMKRKLQVAIAMIGGSRVVFLDEPTSGMDPHARRAMWALLRGLKRGRAIVLTTHYMDEADLLCDRIAIMSDGKLRCCGSSLYLKAKYGIGYNLTMTKSTPACNSAAVQSLVHTHVPGALTLSSAGGEMAFQLPLSEKPSFAALFEDLERRRGELDIGGYGVSMTTLEEVFLRLGRDVEESRGVEISPAGPPAEVSGFVETVRFEGLGKEKHLTVPSTSDEAGKAEALGYIERAPAPETDGESRSLLGTSGEAEEAFDGRFRVSESPGGGGREPTGQLHSSASNESCGAAPRGEILDGRSFRRAWWELFKKRAIIARRDVKGMLYSILLPVVVIALVLIILKLQINPTGPSIRLDFGLFQTSKAQPVKPTEVPTSGTHTSSLVSLNNSKSLVLIDESDAINGSLSMSSYLLDTAWSHTARYGALAYNDTVLGMYNFSASASTLASLLSGLRLTNPGIWNVTLPPSLNTSLFQGAPSGGGGGTWARTPGPSPGFYGFNGSSWNGSGDLGFGGNSSEVEKRVKGAVGEKGMGLRSHLTVLHNTSSDHSFPAVLGELAQARLRAASGNSSALLAAHNHPLPLTPREAQRLETVLTVLASLFILIPFCYLASTFAVFVVRERAVGAKHLQLASGASWHAYWTATYAWDMVNYVAIVIITMFVFLAYDDRAFVGSPAKALGVFLLLTLFGLSTIPLSYCYSFGFHNFASAQVAIAGLHFVSGFCMVVASIVMAHLDQTEDLNRVLVHFYRAFPPFNFGEGLLKLSAFDLQMRVLGEFASPFRWETLGRPLLLMALEAPVYFLLALAIDAGLLSQLPRTVSAWISPLLSRLPLGSRFDIQLDLRDLPPLLSQDPDVAAERDRVAKIDPSSDAVVVSDLTKVFPASGRDPPKVAVRSLSLGIPRGECFGFLGVNGAGKTTTLSILTGALRPSSGSAHVAGLSVLTQLPAVQRQIGYCPQFDPLLDLMTGREQLYMYARLKGVDERQVDDDVAEIVQAVGLQEHADRVCGAYSGGNKRKLSLALALVGSPSAVFLDEPSSGMDPIARRAMWDIITHAVSRRRMCVVLTTHSMEECEALCSRVGVMVSGQLLCLGSPQHLKSRFGDGYHLEVRATKEDNVARVQDFVSRAFPGSVEEERHGVLVKFRLPQAHGGAGLAPVFRAVEAQRDICGIDDYSVSQATLEQVFLSLASGQLSTNANAIAVRST